MATDNIINLPAVRKAPLTPAERAKAYRDRKRAAKLPTTASEPNRQSQVPHNGGSGARPAPSHPVTITVTPSRWDVHALALQGAALGLAGVGIVINGWYSRSLGSTEAAGWLFLAVGVLSDATALALPSCAARLWATHQRATAAAGWAVWLATFIFAVTASIGFASVNITDVTASRASRITPAVTTAQAQLSDAMVARDRECKGGVGKFCREREAAVTERQQQLNAALASVEKAADPQTEAAIHIVSWLSAGYLKPTGDDFNMLRLVLLALLPQIGGILLMIARAK